MDKWVDKFWQGKSSTAESDITDAFIKAGRFSICVSSLGTFWHFVMLPDVFLSLLESVSHSEITGYVRPHA